MKRLSQGFIAAVLLLVSTVTTAVELNQAAFVTGTTTYRFGHNSIPTIAVTGAPADTDFSRWAMLHDGTDYRLYFFKSGTRDTLYQFGFNRAASAYQWAFQSIPVLRITGAPADADTGSFAMLHDGSDHRLYLRPKERPTTLYQFAFNRTTSNYEYGYNSIPQIPVAGFPRDTDWGRWAMLHDGEFYRFYAFKAGNNSQFYQAAFNRSVSQYQYQYESIPVLTLVGTPANSNTGSAAMLHDGDDFRFYFQTASRGPATGPMTRPRDLTPPEPRPRDTGSPVNPQVNISGVWSAKLTGWKNRVVQTGPSFSATMITPKGQSRWTTAAGTIEGKTLKATFLPLNEQNTGNMVDNNTIHWASGVVWVRQ